ncbi:MAG: ligase-associated DNA damage response endonuclease PdeM [Hyphomicrobiaceae bacterium]
MTAVLQLKPERFDLRDFGNQPVEICGKAFIADQSGALYWPAEDALIVADLHFEKGSSRAAAGRLLPPYDTRATLMKLAEVLDRFPASTVIALGDSLHDVDAAGRMSPADFDILHILQEDRDWIWLNGNHDPEIAAAMGGRMAHELVISGLTFRHAPRDGRVTHEIAGHLHPAAKLSWHGHTLRRPCFVGNGLRLVMPAFGAYTGGLNVLQPPFLPVFGHDGFSVWMLGREGLYPVATRQLVDD